MLPFSGKSFYRTINSYILIYLESVITFFDRAGRALCMFKEKKTGDSISYMSTYQRIANFFTTNQNLTAFLFGNDGKAKQQKKTSAGLDFYPGFLFTCLLFGLV